VTADNTTSHSPRNQSREGASADEPNRQTRLRGTGSETCRNDWKADADLGGLRDEPELAKLPADEQKACRALWAEVDALLAKFPGAKPASGH
jgi:hypothetical protein